MDEDRWNGLAFGMLWLAEVIVGVLFPGVAFLGVLLWRIGPGTTHLAGEFSQHTIEITGFVVALAAGALILEVGKVVFAVVARVGDLEKTNHEAWLARQGALLGAFPELNWLENLPPDKAAAIAALTPAQREALVAEVRAKQLDQGKAKLRESLARGLYFGPSLLPLLPANLRNLVLSQWMLPRALFFFLVGMMGNVTVFVGVETFLSVCSGNLYRLAGLWALGVVIGLLFFRAAAAQFSVMTENIYYTCFLIDGIRQRKTTPPLSPAN